MVDPTPFLLIVWGIFTVVGSLYVYSLRKLNTSAEEYNIKSVNLIEQLQGELKKVKSQKKSSEVRTGLIAEQLAPFVDKFPYPKAPGTDIVFLGRPLDFLVYTDSGIHFVEVKSGKAGLSAKQRRIKKLITEGKVTFEVYRIKGE